MSDLIEFVKQETTLVNDLMFSRESLECYNEKSQKPDEKRCRKVKSLTIETKIGDCPLRSTRHDIEECDELKKLPVNERSKVFFKKKLCYGCCQLIGDGHNYKAYIKRKNAEIALENIQQYCIVCNQRKTAKANRRRKSGKKKQINLIV